MNLKTKYKTKIVPLLQKEFGFSSVMQVPKIEKIVINMGVGDATKDAKLLELAQAELQAISGQNQSLLKHTLQTLLSKLDKVKQLVVK